MKRAKLAILSWVILTLIITGCSSTEENANAVIPKGEFATGVFIVNEGNFTESNGSISFFNKSKATIDQDIFEKANSISPGGVIQSIYFYQDLAFIIDQLGNRIEVVEAETFKSVATINAGLSTPRYMVVVNGKGYVSNWGDFDNVLFDYPDSYVAVIDLTSYMVTKSIQTENGSDGIFDYGGQVYVANSYSNTIESIDPGTDEVGSSMVVADSPLGFVEDKNGKVWVLSSSFFTGSVLSQVDLITEMVLKSFSVSGSAKSLNINGAGDTLYYLAAPFGNEAEVKAISIDASTDAAEALIVGSNLYGLGVDPVTGIIYLGNHNGFQGNGTVIRYEDGTLLDSYATGIAPNGFVFRE